MEKDHIDSFIDVVDHLCRHPFMWVMSGSYFEVCAYLTGYAKGSPNCPLSGDGCTAFHDYVCFTFRFPHKYVWPGDFHYVTDDDAEAIEQLRTHLIDFCKRLKLESPQEIVRKAFEAMSTIKEGEPEKTWRLFSRAINRGKKDEIEPLILDHPNAELLWSTSCPDEAIASQLDHIEESFQISQIGGSEQDGDVKIITPDFGPVSVRRIDGQWRVDATKVIECKKRVRGKMNDG